MVALGDLAKSHARTDAAAALFRQHEWVLPPYFMLGFLTRVADRVRAASDPLQQLDIELEHIYDANYLAAMLKERYPGVIDVRDFVPSIGEAFESAALRCWRSAITTLLTAIEGILRQAAPRVGATTGNGTKWLPVAIDKLSQRVARVAQLEAHGETNEQLLASARRADDEWRTMLTGFRDFARDFLLDHTSTYSGRTGLNRHAILHGIDASSFAKPGNFYRLVTLLDILCFTFTIDTPNAPMLAPEDTARSQELAAYYTALTATAARRPV